MLDGMKKQKVPHRVSPEILYLSFLGIGFIGLAPGTLATLAAVPLFVAFSLAGGPSILLIPLLLFATVVSCFVVDAVQKKYRVHDPNWIVIDEVLGLGLGHVFVREATWEAIVTLVLLFRLFDITKPYPASFFDRKVSHGAGVILDDTVSGLYAGLSLHFIFYPYVFPLLTPC